MPVNQTLSKALSNSGSGFNTALKNIMQQQQNLQRAQFAKQQMASELEQQKALIDYRTDAQIQAQQEIYETTTKPQKQAEAAQQQREDFIKSQREAATKASDLRQKRILDTPAHDYGLLKDYDFQPTLEADGNVYTSPVSRAEDGEWQEISLTEFDNYQIRANEVATVLQDIEARAEEGELGEVDGDIIDEAGNIQIGSNNYKGIIRDVRREGVNGPTAQALLAARQNRSISISEAPDRVVEKTTLNSTAMKMNMLYNNVKSKAQDPSNPYQLVLASNVPFTQVNSTINPFDNEDVQASLRLNQLAGYGDNAKRIERFAEQFEIDMSVLKSIENEQAINAIRSGNMEVFEDAPEEYEQLAEGLNTMRELMGRDQFNYMFSYYAETPRIYNKWVDQGFFGDQNIPSLNDVIVNPNFEGNIRNLLTKVSPDESMSQALNTRQSYLTQ